MSSIDCGDKLGFGLEVLFACFLLGVVGGRRDRGPALCVAHAQRGERGLERHVDPAPPWLWLHPVCGRAAPHVPERPPQDAPAA